MGIKIGCAAWTWTEPAHNPPYEEAIKSIGELGFDGIELILRDFEDVENYWTKDKRKEIKSMVDYYRPSGFSICNVPECYGWVGQFGRRKEESFD